MKRTIFTLIILISALTAFARPPRLTVETLFDGRYNSHRDVSTSIYKNNGNYYRGLTIKKKNPTIVRQITGAIAADRNRASQYSEHNDGNGRYTSLQVTNNGATIHIGLQIDNDGKAFFFIQGKEKAFK